MHENRVARLYRGPGLRPAPARDRRASRLVPPGTDGGISPLGQLCAIGAALYTSIVGWFVLAYLARSYGFTPTLPVAPAYVLIPATIGFLGCQIDSVLGATLERRGLVNKKTVNLVSTTSGAILSYLILVAAGPLPA